MANEIAKPEENPTHDFTLEDLEKIEKFKNGGMLQLANVTENDIKRMMDMYLSGRTYRQISRIMSSDKSMIMYLSQKLDWYGMRKTYIEELGLILRDKVPESKLQSQEFLLKLQSTFERKIGRKMDRYLRTDDESVANAIDLKEIDKYLKIVETINRLNSDKSFGERPMVGLNPGEGMTIQKIGENRIEITPTSGIQTRLKEFADLKRKATQKQSSDISKEQTTEGDISDDVE
jgi:hypothetical protein